jgi:DNA-binding PadR family transcriptional regulator
MGATEIVLAVLMDGPKHGYEVKRMHDEWFPTSRPLAFGQVYASLARLAKDECVEVVETRVESGPERTVYSLTSRGRERVEHWLSDPVVEPPPGADELVRKTVVAVRTAADPRPMLARQRVTCLKQMRELRQSPDAGDPLAGLVREYALEQLDAHLRWLDRALERVSAVVTTPAAATSTPTTIDATR